ARIKHGHGEIVEAEIALVRDGGALARMVVAAQRQSRAVASGAGDIGVAQGIARTIHAGALAVPDADHAVVARLSEHAVDLAALQKIPSVAMKMQVCLGGAGVSACPQKWYFCKCLEYACSTWVLYLAGMSDYLAFDLGAESGRAIRGKLDSGRLSLEELHRFA